MFRPTSRLVARTTAVRAVPRLAAPPTRRFISSAPPTQKSRSWKSLFARVGAAGAIIYYYNTTDVFAEEPSHPIQPLPETDDENEVLPTIDALAQERQRRRQVELAAAEKAASAAGAEATGVAGGVEGLEEEADQQGAFNPETGEINWDCPCLGGMADGPCGEEFKAAFSCFVYSTEEPKGMDCVDKFKNMQNCFRQYPEVYGSELDTDEDLDEPADGDRVNMEDRDARVARANAASEQVAQDHGDAEKHQVGHVATDDGKPVSGPDAATQAAPLPVKKDDGPLPDSGEDLLPKAVYDQTAANNEVDRDDEKK